MSWSFAVKASPQELPKTQGSGHVAWLVDAETHQNRGFWHRSPPRTHKNTGFWNMEQEPSQDSQKPVHHRARANSPARCNDQNKIEIRLK